MTDAIFTEAMPLDELPDGEMKALEINGKAVLLCHTGDQIYAVENRCSHAQEKLDCGRMRRGWISCPVHGARFDLATGDPINPPATQPIVTFPCRVVGGTIEVAV